ncbi:MAG: Serine-type D-Ala-D-Ala carboxypeptidase [Hyphomicrobiales bacterium]|nr:Serine-type D-Ala-D-Ala carboxypeptidase [Hyphomicrobiales bacterium]
MVMSGVVGRRRRGIVVLAGLGLVLSATVHIDSADARGRRHHVRHHSVAGTYAPPFAALVVDANSGRTLFSKNENELRHPASITKVMTLYMLFEALERGKLTLETPIMMSAHAASMEPSKLGLRPGQSLSVEAAIKSVVTKSCNDVAVAIAEALGGSEDHFAEMMTAKAQSLGMSRTRYVNASGLPDDEQITTAHDLVILGRSLQERFPKYYGYFSTHVFRYAGSTMRNHNHLLGRVEGMDGIKTGYTRASGFNLLTSVRRDGQHLVAVVLGGKSAGVRDKIMADLIEDKIELASRSRTAPAIAARQVEPLVAVAQVEAPKPEPVRIETPRPVQVASLAPIEIERPRPAYVPGLQRPASDPASTGSIEYRGVSLDGSTGPRLQAAAVIPTSTPSNMRWVTGPAATVEAKPKIELRAETRVARVEPTRLEQPARVAEKPAPKPVAKVETPAPRPAAARKGIMIQIGATDAADKASELLARAKASGRGTLSAATAFTESVKKGSETLYRARFAGLDENQAEAACKTLKRSGFGCFTTKN